MSGFFIVIEERSGEAGFESSARISSVFVTVVVVLRESRSTGSARAGSSYLTTRNNRYSTDEMRDTETL